MSTSGVTTYNLTRDQIIAGALRMLGVVAQGEAPTAIQITEAAEALNLMVKAFEADGMALWGITEYAVPLTNGVASYQIGVGKTINTPKPLKVIQAYNRDSISKVDIPMRIITRQEYNTLGNKTSSGNPIQCWYTPKLDHGVLTLFPVPNTTTATNNQVYIVYQRSFEDFTASGDNPDFPQEWLECLKYGLAVRLAPEYGLDTESRKFLSQEYNVIRATALSFGTEEGSITFGVDRRGY